MKYLASKPCNTGILSYLVSSIMSSFSPFNFFHCYWKCMKTKGYSVASPDHSRPKHLNKHIRSLEMSATILWTGRHCSPNSGVWGIAKTCLESLYIVCSGDGFTALRTFCKCTLYILHTFYHQSWAPDPLPLGDYVKLRLDEKCPSLIPSSDIMDSEGCEVKD